MFKGNHKADISFEQNTCDCNCAILNHKVQNNPYHVNDNQLTNSISDKDCDASRNNLSFST
jgi:hypothetical protein